MKNQKLLLEEYGENVLQAIANYCDLYGEDFENLDLDKFKKSYLGEYESKEEFMKDIYSHRLYKAGINSNYIDWDYLVKREFDPYYDYAFGFVYKA